MPLFTIVFYLTLVVCSVALPVTPDINHDRISGNPIFLEESRKLDDDLFPVLYTIVPSESNKPAYVKRETKQEEQDDLETAAGNYALRPLFVYRQQVAYRQRARDAYRRRNGF